MTRGALEERLYEAGAAALARGPADAASRSARLRSLERFRALGLPSKKDESWRYLPHRRVFRETLAAGWTESSDAEARETLLAATRGLPFEHHLVFVDGRYHAGLSSTAVLPAGMRLIRGSALENDPISNQRRAKRAGREVHAVAALTSALAEEELLVRISGSSSTALALIHLTTVRGEAPIASGELSVHVEAGAQGSLVQVFAHAPGSTALCSHRTLLHLDEAAHLETVLVAATNAAASTLIRTEVELGRRSSYRGHQFLLEGGVLRNELDLVLGEEAKAELGGLALAGADGHAEHELSVHHRAPRSRSEQVYRTIASERGHTAFSGRVIVDEVAHGSVAHQSSKNLLLSREAEVDTRPQLEIYAKEVEASHGATVGQLEEEQLFYLSSRGLDPSLASAMLRAAFVEESFQGVVDTELRAWLRRRALPALGVPVELAEIGDGT